MPQYIVDLIHNNTTVTGDALELLSQRKLLLQQSCTPLTSIHKTPEPGGNKAKSVIINRDYDKYDFPTNRGNARNSKNYFIKNAHSNEWVNLEILAGKLAGLSGILLPWTILASGFEAISSFPESLGKRKDRNEMGDRPYYFIASQRLKGFRDLINIPELLDNNKHVFYRDPNQRVVFEKYYKEFTSLEKHKCTSSTEFKTKRIEIFSKLYKTFPLKIRDMIEESFAVSIWLGNWDFLNFDLENIGITALYSGNKLIIEPAMVDMGNCLYAGFDGKHKENSFDIANKRAKTSETNPGDDDPEIDESHKIPKYAAQFGSKTYMQDIKNMPRRLPSEPILQDISDEIYKFLDPSTREHATLSEGFIRGLYRVSKIPDKAIKTTIDEWFMLGSKINYSYSDQHHYTKEELFTVMSQRRDHLVDLFNDPITYYSKKNKYNAMITDKELRDAVKDITGIDMINTIQGDGTYSLQEVFARNK